MGTPFLLSDKEDTLLLLLADGYTAKEIGEWLEVTQNTINLRIIALRSKMGAKTNPHLIALAYHRGILIPKNRG